MRKKIKLLIAGAGFGGLKVASRLRKAKNLDIKIIDKSDCFLFTPSLYGYLLGRYKKKDVTLDLNKKFRRGKVNFVRENIENIDLKEKKLVTNKSSHNYDYLVLSLGSDINTFNIKGTGNSVGFKSIGHADKIKKKMKKLNSGSRINIVGSGLIAVELASCLRKYFGKKRPEICLLGQNLMQGFSGKLRKKIKKDFNKKRIYFGKCIVKKINPKSIVFEKNGKEYKTNSDISIIATGFKIPEVAKNFGLECDNRGIKINSYFETSSDGIFSIGDCNIIEQENKSEKKRAQVAEKEGKRFAKNLLKKIKGNKMKPYSIKEIPTIIKTPPVYFFVYKDFHMKNRIVNLIEKLVKIKSFSRKLLKF